MYLRQLNSWLETGVCSVPGTAVWAFDFLTTLIKTDGNILWASWEWMGWGAPFAEWQKIKWMISSVVTRHWETDHCGRIDCTCSLSEIFQQILLHGNLYPSISNILSKHALKEDFNLFSILRKGLFVSLITVPFCKMCQQSFSHCTASKVSWLCFP